jgi:hypothetical protein
MKKACVGLRAAGKVPMLKACCRLGKAQAHV